jgi:hypothetical protein
MILIMISSFRLKYLLRCAQTSLLTTSPSLFGRVDEKAPPGRLAAPPCSAA